MKILLVEDDNLTGVIVTNFLTAHQYQVSLATDGEMAIELTKQFEYDLIILDIIIPKLNGISLCKYWRHQGFATPILLLTVKDQVTDKIIGLEAGADDYVTKPFNLEELLARIRALLRRTTAFISQDIIWDHIHFDPISGRVTCGTQSVHLTPKEYCLLELFLLNPRRIFSRQAILDRLWDFAEFPGEGTVSTHIKSLRHKLKAVGAENPIETVYGFGYRLNNPTELSTSSIEDDAKQKAYNITSEGWNRFKNQYAELANELSQMISILSPTKSTLELQEQAEQIAHKLAGALGIFGLMNASQQARKLEILLKYQVLDDGQIQEAIELSKVIQQEIANFPGVLANPNFDQTCQANKSAT